MWEHIQFTKTSKEYKCTHALCNNDCLATNKCLKGEDVQIGISASVQDACITAAAYMYASNRHSNRSNQYSQAIVTCICMSQRRQDSYVTNQLSVDLKFTHVLSIVSTEKSAQLQNQFLGIYRHFFRNYNQRYM